jgi:hypothetical protein
MIALLQIVSLLCKCRGVSFWWGKRVEKSRAGNEVEKGVGFLIVKGILIELDL